MNLVRLDSNPHLKPDDILNEHRQEAFGVERNEDALLPTARVKFQRFGLGEHRRPSFAVDVTWIDVESLLREFIEMGDPHAVHLHRMVMLASAIEKAGWAPDDAPEKEFWEFRDSVSPPQSN